VTKNSVKLSRLPSEVSSRRSMKRVPYWRESWDRWGACCCSAEAACQLAGKSAMVTRWSAWRSRAEMLPPAVIATPATAPRPPAPAAWAQAVKKYAGLGLVAGGGRASTLSVVEALLLDVAQHCSARLAESSDKACDRRLCRLVQVQLQPGGIPLLAVASG